MTITLGRSRYNLTPTIRVSGFDGHCWSGWQAIGAQIQKTVQSLRKDKVVVTVECYPGVDPGRLLYAMQQIISFDAACQSDDAFLDQAAITALIQPDLTNDPVFGRITQLNVDSFFDPDKKQRLSNQITAINSGLIVVIGTGASVLCHADLLIYADLPRWEAQLRFRRNESSNLGVSNEQADASLQYKQAFFVDWRVADQLKTQLMGRWDYWLDTVDPHCAKMTSGAAIRGALQQTARRPFSVVPYFDPAPWGGDWMKERFGLDPSQNNYGWSFNCVPEENSLIFEFGATQVESPAINVVFYQSVELLGSNVYEKFGAEFPIRFDFLDTMNGGNLSFQVHPIQDYIHEQFGMTYTQDESYYLLDAAEDACVYLGLKEKINADEMMTALRAAQNGGAPFDADQFAERWPAKKHDHFLIPAGTVHCSGRNSMVLEISATPYLFTFKLWDWGRLGLNGSPRPIHIHHGENVIQWERTANWIRRELINRVEPITVGDGWREERTGLHELEFIETRRHWFTKTVSHNTQNTVNVLCLVQGEQIVVESPEETFEPFVVNYGEAFIVPASVGDYCIRPTGRDITKEYATMKAFVR